MGHSDHVILLTGISGFSGSSKCRFSLPAGLVSEEERAPSVLPHHAELVRATLTDRLAVVELIGDHDQSRALSRRARYATTRRASRSAKPGCDSSSYCTGVSLA
jgi:hypothetical protein